MSEGITDTAFSSISTQVTVAFANTLLGSSLNVASTQSNSTTYFRDLGTGQTATGFTASTTYTANGDYLVALQASN